MGPVIKNVTQAFSRFHPNHPLMHHSDDLGYVCRACKTSGFGDRLRCHACDVDMHMYCAYCPQKLSSFHKHRLTLVDPKAQGARPNHQFCDVCLKSIDGLFYRCNDCDFDLHPICSQLPQELRHVADEHHKLRLKKLSSGNCVVCTTDCCSLWVYGCGICKVNIHIKCLRKPYHSQSTQSKEIPVPPSCSDESSSRARGIPYAQPWWSTGPPPFLCPPYLNGHQGASGHWGFLNHQFVYPSVPLAYINSPSHSGHTGSSSRWKPVFESTVEDPISVV